MQYVEYCASDWFSPDPLPDDSQRYSMLTTLGLITYCIRFMVNGPGACLSTRLLIDANMVTVGSSLVQELQVVGPHERMRYFTLTISQAGHWKMADRCGWAYLVESASAHIVALTRVR